MSDGERQMNSDRDPGCEDREGKKRDLSGLSKVGATMSQSGVQGKGGRQEPQLALKSERKLPTGLKGLSYSISA